MARPHIIVKDICVTKENNQNYDWCHIKYFMLNNVFKRLEILPMKCMYVTSLNKLKTVAHKSVELTID
jgi:hypothetical protein